nr:unnamed protein product [Digitaria exilis]
MARTSSPHPRPGTTLALFASTSPTAAVAGLLQLAGGRIPLFPFLWADLRLSTACERWRTEGRGRAAGQLWRRPASGAAYRLLSRPIGCFPSPLTSSQPCTGSRSRMGVDIHEIFVKKSRLRVVLSYIGIVFLLVNVSQPLLAKESLSLGSVWNITFAVLVAKCFQYKPVKKALHFLLSFPVSVCRVSSDYASFWGSGGDSFLEVCIILILLCVSTILSNPVMVE